MKTAKKISILRPVFCVFLALCIMHSALCICSAAEAPAAQIAGTQVNLGGDISMKFYVAPAEGVATDRVTLKINFLGVSTELKHPERVTINGEMYYLFTFKGIPPHCMGDVLAAQLFVDGAATGTVESYSVAGNLAQNYEAGNSVTKQLIVDVIEYGAAAQIHRGYQVNDLVSAQFAVDEDTDAEVPTDLKPTISQTDTGSKLETVTVNFSSTNTLKFKLSPSTLTGVQINGNPPASTYVSGDYLIVETAAIAPTDFDERYKVTFGNDNSVEYSINDYICAVSVSDETTDNMKALAKALYNYGLSAEKYQHAQTGEHTNATYRANGATITVTCPSCGDVGSVTLVDPTDLTYTGTVKHVTLNSTVVGLDTSKIEITYSGDRVNVTDDGFTASITLGDATATLNVKIIASPLPTVKAPTATRDLTFDGDGQNLVNAGTTLSGKMQYRLGDSGEWSDEVPTATDAGDYTVWWRVVDDENNALTEEKAVAVTIYPMEYVDWNFSLGEYEFVYTGNPIEPKVNVTSGSGETLSYYTVAYGNNVNIGEAYVIVTLTGNYTGEYKQSFLIVAPENMDIPGEFDGELIS